MKIIPNTQYEKLSYLAGRQAYWDGRAAHTHISGGHDPHFYRVGFFDARDGRPIPTVVKL